jgi:hypothetical protein
MKLREADDLMLSAKRELVDHVERPTGFPI